MADLAPPAPVGGGVGTLPSWSNPGVEPPAPRGDADHVGVMTPFPDSSGDVHPAAPKTGPHL